MASRRKPEPPGEPEVGAVVGMKLLQKQIARAHELLGSRPLSEDAHSQWELLTRNYLEKAFGVGSSNVSSVTDVGKYGSFPMNAGEAWWEQNRAETLQSQVAHLEGLVELLETESQLQQGRAISTSDPSTDVAGHRVFLVHGHDEGTMHEVARFLEQLDQDVIVLREQPNSGRTIIEKFEDYSEVAFSVVLLTSDDQGGPMGQPLENQLARARQNVVLELGYFLGKLGRQRVCALYREGVEIPSDYSGVLYVPLDPEGAWRLKLAKELKAANLPVDMNKAL
jgi:predicted nucleotide-binding protein